MRTRFVSVGRDAEPSSLWLVRKHGTTLATPLEVVNQIGNELVTAFGATTELST